MRLVHKLYYKLKPNTKMILRRYRTLSHWNVSKFLSRNINGLELWHQDLTTEIKLKIEKHWAKEVISCNTNNEDNTNTYYVLPMFPYPSGNLHMGHVRVYSISDTIAKFERLNGKCVIHPIGWDAFGLPAENAAIEHKIPPIQWTNSNIESMKSQLLKLGFDFDWNREISTCDVKYYKWTQYIFLKLFEQGLAYQSKALVNWDPVDQTVLADEQVDDIGCSWRSGAKVEKKLLKQWFIKTTKFAQKLYDGLNSTSLENWNDIINLQKHWIGECDGVIVNFKLNSGDLTRTFEVWTSHSYKFIHGQFLAISSNNVVINDIPNNLRNNLTAINPITNAEIPIYIVDNAHYPNGRDVLIACPKWDQEDHALAQSLNYPGVFEENTIIDLHHENQKALEMALEKDVGGHRVSSKLKDWLISRQRFWGTPIPIIHCVRCGAVPVPLSDLPVTLPDSSSSQTGIQTLADWQNWVNCKCPKCHSDAKRETDTMDTFVDSSWYYYRFLDCNNTNRPFEKKKLEGNTPVHLYIGGKEHAVLHLYYARFMSYFLHSLGWTPTEEPFKKLVVQGMVMGQSYKVKSSGKYIPAQEVEQIGKKYKQKGTGADVIVQWEKMSKSKHNGENPERLLATLGSDTTRLMMLSDVPPATSRHWSDATLPGVLNWQNRLWMTVTEFLKHRNDLSSIRNIDTDEFLKHELKLWDSRNYYTATTTFHFKHTQKLSVGISRLQGLTNTLRNKNLPPGVISNSKEFELALASLIIMLAPVTPHFCSELWAGFLSAPNRICDTSSFVNWDKNVLEQKWPVVDDHFKLSLQCKVDGADRCELKIEARELGKLQEAQAVQLMIEQPNVAKRIKTGILRTKYELFPGIRAILHIYTNRKVQKEQVASDVVK